MGSCRNLASGRGGLIGGWVRGAILPVDEVGRSVGGFVAQSRRCWGATRWRLDRCGWIGVMGGSGGSGGLSELVSFFFLSLSLLLSLSLFAHLMSPEMV